MSELIGTNDAICTVPSFWRPPAAPPAVPEVVARAQPGDLRRSLLQDDVWLLESDGPVPPPLRLPLGPGAHAAGGGMQFGRMDLAGRVLDGWCMDTAFGSSYFHAPVLHVSDGWTLIVDTVARYQLDVGAADPGELRLTLATGRLRAFVVVGPPLRGLEVLIELTGAPPLPPPWAFGVWHNVRSGHDAVLAQARRLRDEHIPASALWIDDHYDSETNDGDGWPGNYPSGEYPDMRRLVREVHELGFRALTYVNPMLYRDTPACRDAVARGLVVTGAGGKPGYQHFFHPLRARRGMVDFEDATAVPLDFTNPEAVAWWQERMRRLLADRDWDGWMEDFGEQVPETARLHDGSSGAETHNRYPLLYHGATADVRLETKPDAVVFARSGWLGAHRLAPVYWGGDQVCSWDDDTGIPSVIAGGLSAALSGVASWGPDITGIVSLDKVPLNRGAGDRELWLRWCQLGALTPVMRTHLGFKPDPTPPLDLWHDAEMTDAFRRNATLHLRLFPYLYSLASEASRGGPPIMRPLLLEYPEDEQCWTIAHEFLLGDALLVAPVIEHRACTRLVYFPDGVWYELGSAHRHQGPGWEVVDAPLERIPVFQREGTTIPLLADSAPTSLVDEAYRRGEYDVELLVTPGTPRARTLHDGTVIAITDGTLTVDGAERTVLVRCGGHASGLAHGSKLEFDLRPIFELAERMDGRSGASDFGIIHAARHAESLEGLHHDERIEPEPARPGAPVTLHVREAPDVHLDTLAIRYTVNGDDPLAAPTAALPMTREHGPAGETAGARWRVQVPAQPEGSVVRYAFEGQRGAESVWAEDAGPGLEQPDLTTAFVRPRERRFSYAVTSRTVPQWLRESTIYHVLVDRFHPGGSASLPRDASVRFLQHAGGTLRGATEHLDHIAELGANCILLSPITHGVMHVPYDAVDLFAVDPRLGSLEDARTLCREAHALGIRVLLDGEFSFLGYRHPYFQEARRVPESEYRDWFRWHSWPDRPYSWFGGRMLVTLDHAHRDVRRHLLDAARFWLDAGFDGFRLDSAGAAPFDFWTEFGATVRAANPDAVTLGEVFGSAELLGHYRGRFDGALDFTVPYALRECFGTGSGSPADVARGLASMRALDPDDLVVPIFIENHDVPRFSHIAGGEEARLREALTILMTLGPPPILYYGTEVGRLQGARADIDPDARLPMLWGAAQDRSLFDFVARLVRLRRETPALSAGEHIPLLADSTVLAYARRRGGATVVVATNAGPQQRTVELDLSALLASDAVLHETLGTPAEHRARGGRITLVLAPHQTAVLASAQTSGAVNGG